MTIKVGIGEAKRRLSQLIAAAIRGEEVVITNRGVPVVRIEPIAERVREENERRLAKAAADAQPI